METPHLVVTMKHEFVDIIPDQLSNGVLYVSLKYGTAAHKCCCGCGKEVVTPITPTDWRLIYDGETVSLYPSIGNWGFDCRSHYWIKNGRVEWAEDWSDECIAAGRGYDRNSKLTKYRKADSSQVNDGRKKVSTPQSIKTRNLWDTLRNWFDDEQ